MTVGKMIELLGGKAVVSCGRFHYGSAFGEPSCHADTVEAMRCFLHLFYSIRLLCIFPYFIFFIMLPCSMTVKFLWTKASATTAKTFCIQVKIFTSEICTYGNPIETVHFNSSLGALLLIMFKFLKPLGWKEAYFQFKLDSGILACFWKLLSLIYVGCSDNEDNQIVSFPFYH